MTISKTDKHILDKAGRFLSDYAALLLNSGATCARLEENVKRIADTWGLRVETTIMPRHISLSVMSEDCGPRIFMSGTGKTSISFSIVSRLSRISWDIADKAWDIDRAEKAFRSAEDTGQANRWWVLFAASCANGAFCRLFSGDAVAAAVVLVATKCGLYLKQLLRAKKVDIRIAFAACAFVSSVIACADKLFSLGTTPDIAIGTSVLYLVPGIPLLNAFSDMLDRHYICFFSRMTDALVLVCCLSIGLCAGMRAMEIGMF